jgi:hypothetical protein
VLELPPLAGKIALQGGVWIPASDAVAAGVVAGSDTVADAATPSKSPRWVWWIAVVVVLLIGGAWWRRRRKNGSS